MSVLMRTYSLEPSIIVHKIMYYKACINRKVVILKTFRVLSLLRFKKKKKFLFIMWKQGILYTTYDEFRLNEFVV